MAKIEIVIEPQGIAKVRASGIDHREKLASLRFMETLLPAIDRFDAILSEYLDEEAASDGDR